MSSHHIVRDEQEPALVLWQPSQLSFEQAEELLAWSPTLIVHTQAIAEASSWKIKVDGICGLQTTLPSAELLLSHQHPFNSIPLPKAEPLHFLLAHLAANNHRAINITLPSYTEASKLWAQAWQAGPAVLVGVISKGFIHYRVNTKISKWLPAGSKYRIIEVKTEGVVGSVAKKTTAQEGMLTVALGAPFWIGWKLS